MLDDTILTLRRHDLRWDVTPEEYAAGVVARCRDCGEPFADAETWLAAVCEVGR